MKSQLKLFKIDMKYIRELSNVDDNVMSVSPQLNKDKRPFVGVLVLLNNKKYCIPLSSPKPKFEHKKNTVDFMRIIDESKKNVDGTGKIIGALNFNNMIPVSDAVIKQIDIKVLQEDSAKTINYKMLLTKQLNWCQKNEEKLLSHANKTYMLVTEQPDKNIGLTRRSCNFKKLENVLEKRMQRTIKEEKSFTISRKVIKENANRVKADACFAEKKSKHHTHNI